MELNTIIELVKAGFSKDDIMQMEQAETPTPDPVPVQPQTNLPEQKPEPVQAQVNEPVAVPVPQPQPAQEPAQEQPSMSDIMHSIAKLTSAIQANAIAQSVIPSGMQKQPTAEDMIAQIIRPTYKGKEG